MSFKYSMYACTYLQFSEIESNWCVQVTYCGSYHRNTQNTAGNNGGGCTCVTGVFRREQYNVIKEREDESDIRAVGLKYGLRNNLVRDQGSYRCGCHLRVEDTLSSPMV